MVFELLETLHRGGFGAIDAVKLDAATVTLAFCYLACKSIQRAAYWHEDVT